MTALAGIWRFDARPDVGPSCTRMLGAQAMYGPKAPSQWEGGAVALGSRLFHTLPEDKFDRQPLVGASGAALVADVRLDNREELTQKLALASDRAARMADSEILLAPSSAGARTSCSTSLASSRSRSGSPRAGA